MTGVSKSRRNGDGGLLVVAFVVSTLTWMPPNWVFGIFGVGIVFSMIFLSMTLITGMSGQVSLCQMAFAGIGGFGAGQLANPLQSPDPPRCRA